tara:strand:+ start:2568 stop:3320 length:753 start_codon:yes stop_codon:yes gene_type:complete
MDSHEAKTEGCTMDSSDQGRDVAGMTSTSERGVDSGRRSFTKVGLAAPVLLAMVNRTAWASPACAPSAFMSATIASLNPSQIDCGQPVGKSPGYWKNKPEEWPAPYYPDPKKTGNKSCSSSSYSNTQGDDQSYQDGGSEKNHTYCRSTSKFNAVFNCSSPYPDNWTLMEVLRNGNGNAGMQNVEFHAVAALLNAASGQANYNLSVAQVIDIFCDLIPGGCHTISTGHIICWDSDPYGVGWTFKQYFDNYL